MTEVNLKECCIHPVTYAQALMDRAEAAEAQRDELAAQLSEIRMLLNAAEGETTSDAAARIVDLLATARADLAHERMAHNRSCDAWGAEITRRESAEQGLALMNQKYSEAMTRLSKYDKVTA